MSGEMDLETAKAEIERLKAECRQLKLDSCVPGAWHCRTCGFTLFKNVIAPNGVFANPEIVTEACKNDGDVLFPMTWKEAELSSRKAIDRIWERGKAMEAAARNLSIAIKPCMDLAGMNTAGMIRSCGKCERCGSMTPSGGIKVCRKCGAEAAYAAIEAFDAIDPEKQNQGGGTVALLIEGGKGEPS